MSGESRERGGRNVEKIERVGNMQPELPHVGVAHLEYVQFEHHFRPGTIQLIEKLGCGLQRRLRPAQRDRTRRGVEAGELELK